MSDQQNPGTLAGDSSGQMQDASFSRSTAECQLPKLLNPAEACELLAIGSTLLGRLTADQTIPSLRIGRLRRYRLADLVHWVDSGCPRKGV